ncbi:MAG: RelA/SpoT family protein [Candidatus Dojkabacteria bacterium]|nr:RelA/SpoT family protein [Candidatus Dojkabacteria bacterium]
MKKIQFDDVLKRAKNITKNDIDFVKKAYEYAKKAHKGQKRKTGEAYIIHPLYVAYYVAGLGLGRDTLAASFLHDVIENCGVTEKQLTKEFNETVAKLVTGVSKLRHTTNRKITWSSVENLRRFFLVAAEDIRAVIIKLADRLHNAKTIRGLPPERQKEYAREIQYVFSTLADYLGIRFFKRQFDDVAFEILEPEEYRKIRRYMKEHHKQRRRYVQKIIKKTENLLKENKIKADVFGREKSLYSVFKKIQKYLREGKIHSQSEIGKIYDNYGFRIIVGSNEDCYKVLGLIHSKWHPLTGEFEDFIANPKPNGYRSLHTTVFCENEKIAEFQIRTQRMHDYNEFGPASHIAYKLSGQRNLPTMAFNWLRRINLFRRGLPPAEDSPKYKIKVFQNNVFVLTPQNEVKKLPKGSTPVDFAYTVHTDIGNKCRGAKVNGKMVPLDYQLSTGDQVEIIIDKNAKYPISKWLEFVGSAGARAKIKHALRDKESKEAIQKGFEKLNSELKKHNTTFKELYKTRQNDIDILIYKNNAIDQEGLLANIGFNLISTEKIIAELFPQAQTRKPHGKSGKKVSIEGSTQTEYTLAQCCNPKSSDTIIALTTITRGIRIHKKSCPYIKGFDKDRLLNAEWV